MKVLDITHFYNKKSGGVKTYLEEKVKFLSNKEINHFLVVPSEEEKTQKRLNSKYYFIKSPEVPFFKPYRLLINKNKIFEIINTEKPDIIEVGSPYFIPSWINKNKEKLNCKSIGFFHSNIEGSITSIFKSFDKIFSPPAKKWIKREYSGFDLVISPSKYVEKYLNDIGINSTTTVYLGINSDVFYYRPKSSSFRRKYNIPQEKVILVYAGRISIDKNILDLTKIYNILSFFRPEKYHLVIIGSGHLENKFFKKLKGNFTHLGYIKDKNEYADILSSCDIFITTSKIETFGLALVEAQACGLPVVAYKSSSIPEVTHYKELLAESYDDFVKNIEIVSDYYLQEDKRKNLSQEIRNRFLWEKTFENIISIYRQIKNS